MVKDRSDRVNSVHGRAAGLAGKVGLPPFARIAEGDLRGRGAGADGGARVYAIRYRVGGGRDAAMRRYTIGRHGSPWTAETARVEAKRLLALVAQGKDPASAKAEAKAAPTVAEFAARLLAEHAEAKRKATTAAEYRRLLDHVVLPALGKKRVADVTRQDVAKLHHARRATPTEANRALAVTSTMFNVAERWRSAEPAMGMD